MAWNAQIQTWRTVEFYCWCHGCQFQRQWTSILQSFQRVGSWILEKGRWAMYDSPQCWTCERRCFISHSQILQISSVSTKQLRIRVVNCSTNTWSTIPKPGEIRRENEWAVMSKNWSLRPWIRWYKHLRRVFQAARDRLRIHQERFEMVSSETKESQICEWAGFLRKVSIVQYFRTIPDVDDGFWRKDGVMQRVFVTSWSSRFWTYWVDYWTYQDRSSSSSQGHLLSWSVWNWDPGTVFVEKRLLLLDCDFQRPKSQRGWILAWPKWLSRKLWDVSFTSVEQSRTTTSSIEEIHKSKPQAQPRLMNYFSKELIQIDKRSGMTFLPVTLSKENSLGWKISKNINSTCTTSRHLMIDKLTEQFIGVLCVKRNDVISKVKVLEPPTDSRCLGYIHRGSSKPRLRILRTLEQQPRVCSRHPSWLLLNWWIMLQCHSDGKKSCFM